MQLDGNSIHTRVKLLPRRAKRLQALKDGANWTNRVVAKCTGAEDPSGANKVEPRDKEMVPET